jgi:uncharacterized membrane protein YdjX (TVP38/TMEM64 family)
VRTVRSITGFTILAASFAFAAYVVANRSGIDQLLAAVGPFRIPLAIVIFAIAGSAPFSVTDALSVSNGALFGAWLGSAINFAGLVLASVIGYAVALSTSASLDMEGQIARLPAWVKRFEIGSPLFLIVVRLIPGVGGTIATQTAAALHVSLWRQIYTLCAVAVPLSTILAFGGDAASMYINTHVHKTSVRTLPLSPSTATTRDVTNRLVMTIAGPGAPREFTCGGRILRAMSLLHPVKPGKNVLRLVQPKSAN